MVRSAFDDLVHRINNLLATIEIQREVARADGTLAAHVQALGSIADAARRTQDEVRALRRAQAADHTAGAGGAGGAAGNGAAADGSSGSIAPSF